MKEQTKMLLAVLIVSVITGFICVFLLKFRVIQKSEPVFICRQSYIEYVRPIDNKIGEYAGDVIVSCN